MLTFLNTQFFKFLTLFRMGGQKSPFLSVFPLNFLQTLESAPKIFQLLVLILLPHCHHVAARASPKLVNLEPRPPLKKMLFFWLNPHKIEVVITSLIEMLELPNFGHMITSTI